MTGFIFGPPLALGGLNLLGFQKYLDFTWKRNVQKTAWQLIIDDENFYWYSVQSVIFCSWEICQKQHTSNWTGKRVEWVEQTLISEKNLSDDTNLFVTNPCHSFLLTIPCINFFIKKVECKETILVSIYFISHQSLCIKLFNASKTSWMLKRTQESATLDISTQPFYQLYNLGNASGLEQC